MYGYYWKYELWKKKKPGCPKQCVVSICCYSVKYINVLVFHHLQANMASSVLRTSSMRFSQLERTSSPPTTSCGPSSCRHPVAVWTRRPHTLWREETLATGRIRSTDWSGGWTNVLVSCRNSSESRYGSLDVVNDAHLFSPSYRQWWILTETKPIMSETTS